MLGAIFALRMRIALVHDWLTTMGGAERVLLALSDLYPDAPIYTSVYVPEAVPLFRGKRVITSFLQRVPFARKHHQLFPGWRPLAFESFDLSQFDVVISSASAEAKGVITKPETVHICYCHTPTRYYWSDYHAYQDRLQFGLLNPLARLWMPRLTKKMRMWDYTAAQRVDYFIANSRTTADRIKKYYGRESEVIYPPVDTESIVPAASMQTVTMSAHAAQALPSTSHHSPSAGNGNRGQSDRGDFYLVVARLVPYKNTALVVEAFNTLKLPLRIVGTGPELAKLKKMNTSSNTQFLEAVSEAEKIRLYQTCRAFIFPAEEDAGITPLEAMAAGKPVIALARGGATETVIQGKTGLFFSAPTSESLKTALLAFESQLEKTGPQGSVFDPTFIRAHAEQFSKERFQNEIKSLVLRYTQIYTK